MSCEATWHFFQSETEKIKAKYDAQATEIRKEASDLRVQVSVLQAHVAANEEKSHKCGAAVVGSTTSGQLPQDGLGQGSSLWAVRAQAVRGDAVRASSEKIPQDQIGKKIIETPKIQTVDEKIIKNAQIQTVEKDHEATVGVGLAQPRGFRDQRSNIATQKTNKVKDRPQPGPSVRAKR